MLQRALCHGFSRNSGYHCHGFYYAMPQGSCSLSPSDGDKVVSTPGLWSSSNAGPRPDRGCAGLKVLLLHSDDMFPPSGPVKHWDLIVDLSRAPAAIYDQWARQMGCPLLSLYQFAVEIEDLQRLRKLLQF